jgi:hypothetical protein
VRFQYSTLGGRASPSRIRVNGTTLPLKVADNPYRRGAARIDRNDFLASLGPHENLVEIEL